MAVGGNESFQAVVGSEQAEEALRSVYALKTLIEVARRSTLNRDRRDRFEDAVEKIIALHGPLRVSLRSLTRPRPAVLIVGGKPVPQPFYTKNYYPPKHKGKLLLECLGELEETRDVAPVLDTMMECAGAFLSWHKEMRRRSEAIRCSNNLATYFEEKDKASQSAVREGGAEVATAELRPASGGFQLYANGVPLSKDIWEPDNPKNGALQYALAKATIDARGEPVPYGSLGDDFKQGSVRTAARVLEKKYSAVFERVTVGRKGALRLITAEARITSQR